jgi:hypothetical protein
MDEPFARAAAGDRHLERRDDELCAHVVGHRPADDPPREAVGDGRRVEPALVGLDLLEVGDPQQVGRRRREVAADEVLGRDDAWRISRSTRLGPTRTPSEASSAWIRGEP